jgi:HSP20 family protein
MSIRRDPFDEMNRMFDQLRSSTGFQPTTGIGSEGMGMGTNLTTETTDEGYVVVADLPGFEKSEIDLRFEDGILRIAAESDVESETETIRSRRQRSVHESVRMPTPVRESGIAATYRNGVLEVTLPTETDSDDGISVDVE